MKSFKGKILAVAAAIVVLAGAGYYFQAPLIGLVQRLENQYLPCRAPLVYKLHSFDTRFGISQQDFLAAVNQAAQIWDKAANKQLFVYGSGGNLTINLIYDYRQEATAKLQQLGIVVHDDESTYNTLKAKYDSLTSAYNQQKAAFDAMTRSYNTQKDAYEAEVAKWNNQGGAPPAQYARLQQERTDLNAQADRLNQAQDSLNSLVDDINAVATILNKLVDELNLNVSKYNSIGTGQLGEFEEGSYQGDLTGGQIDIYQFEDRQRLVRVLAHELGHALGLGHLDDPQAIMYRLNQGNNLQPTAADVAALKNLCGLK